jgi:triacylglycerol esterase/lipase EstA (alpha/beta hydrolase family)
MKLSVFLTLSLIAFCAKAQLIQYQILPSVTDANINTFTDVDQKHMAFLNNSVSRKNQLFVFLPGTGGNPANAQRIDSLAANLGYHAIGLMYPNDPAIGSLCNSSSDIECYTNTRLEIIDGTDRTTLVTVDRANSIENRIVKLLQYLQQQNPSENWTQFLDHGNIIWEKVVIAGHSQGGGHAGLIAKYHEVVRVIFFAAPKDFSTYFSNPANWINTTNQTPANRYFAFTHSSDEFGCTFSQQQTVYASLGMTQFGSDVNIDNVISPYMNSHILTSTRAVSSSINAHSCVVVDNSVPLDVNDIPVYRPVWVYMLNSDISTGTITGMIKSNETDHVSIYPNPATNLLTIKNAKQNLLVNDLRYGR